MTPVIWVVCAFLAMGVATGALSMFFGNVALVAGGEPVQWKVLDIIGFVVMLAVWAVVCLAASGLTYHCIAEDEILRLRAIYVVGVCASVNYLGWFFFDITGWLPVVGTVPSAVMLALILWNYEDDMPHKRSY